MKIIIVNQALKMFTQKYQTLIQTDYGT